MSRYPSLPLKFTETTETYKGKKTRKLVASFEINGDTVIVSCEIDSMTASTGKNPKAGKKTGRVCFGRATNIGSREVWQDKKRSL